MTSVLFLHPNLHLKHIVLNSLKRDIIAYSLNNIDIESDINRIGIMWDNIYNTIPFGNEILELNNYKFILIMDLLFQYNL